MQQSLVTTNANVTTAQGQADAAFDLASSVNTELGIVQAGFSLEADAGAIVGIFANSTGTSSSLIIKSNDFEIRGSDNSQALKYSAAEGQWIFVGGGTFSGDLNAAGGTFSGDLNAAGGTFSGNLSGASGTFSGNLSGATGSFSGSITASSGNIAGWSIWSNLLRSAESGSRIELNASKNRISVFSSSNEKVAMGYLDGLPRNNGGGNFGAADYGFWARNGDRLVIDGEVSQEAQDWIIQSDAAVRLVDSQGKDTLKLGSENGDRGLFIYDETSSIIGELSSRRLFLGGNQSQLSYENGEVQLTGTLNTPKINILSNGEADLAKPWSVLADGSYINRYGDQLVVIGPTAGASDDMMMYIGQFVSQPLRDKTKASFAVFDNGGSFINKGEGRFTNGLVADFNGGFLEVGMLKNSYLENSHSELGFRATGIESYIRFNNSGAEISGQGDHDWPVRIMDKTRIYDSLRVDGVISSATLGHEILLPIDFVAEPGDCIVLDQIVSSELSETLGIGRLSAGKADKGCYGIYTGDYTAYDDQYHLHTLQSIGNGQINAVGESGDIDVDDYLVLSSIPGKVMRQSDDIKRSSTVARSITQTAFSDVHDEKRIPVIYERG